MLWFNRPTVLPADEQALVERGQTGDVGAFNELVERYQQGIFNLALRMLGDQQRAEDVTQETFLAAFQHLGSFRGGSLRSWLFRIATNQCYDQLRHRQRHRADSLDELVDDPENPVDFPDPAETPEAYTLRREVASQIQAGLNRLSAEHRAVLILCDVQGFSYAEAAEITRANVGTIKSRLSRARSALRGCLDKTGYLARDETVDHGP